MALAGARAAAGALAAALVLLVASPGCGTQDEATEVGEAIAALVSSGDCVRLLDVTASVQRALSGAVGTDLAAASAFLSGLSARAPERVSGDLRSLAAAALAVGAADGAGSYATTPVDAAGARAAAARVAAWARQRCPA